MIPKMAIDQAKITHREAMRKIWDAYVAEMDVIWRLLQSAYVNTKKAHDATADAAVKARNSRRGDAWKIYQQATRTGEGASFGTYEEEKLTIDSDCDKEVQHADEVYEKTIASAEEAFRKGKVEIQERYKTDTIACVETFFEAHP